MDKLTEKKIEEKVGKTLSQEIKKEVDEEVKKEVKRELGIRLAEELKKINPKKIYEGTLTTTRKFRQEFKNQVLIAITAAFAFLIALSWRVPIEQLVNLLIERLGLVGKEMYIQFISAMVITIIAVLILIVLSKWKSNDERV